MVPALSENLGGGAKIAGSLCFRRANYWADGRGRKSKFRSAEERSGLTVSEAVDLVSVFLRAMGGSNTCLALTEGKIVCDKMSACWRDDTKSDVLVEKDPPFTAEEYGEFLNLVREKMSNVQR